MDPIVTKEGSAAPDLGVAVDEVDRAFAVHVSICGSESGKHNTIHLAKRCLAEGVPGDFVECGAHGCGQGALMGYVLKQYGGGDRRVHLFDSWDCQPQASPHDGENYRAQLGVNPDPTRGIPSGVFPSTLEQCRENIANWRAPLDRFVFHKGWLQEVLPPLAPTFPAIALLRIDVDLHDSTVPVFEYLYDKVSPGGYIISDDWGETDGWDACRAATLAFFDRRGLPHPLVTRIPTTPGTVWWRKE